MLKRIMVFSIAIFIVLCADSGYVHAGQIYSMERMESQGIGLYWVNTSIISLDISFESETAYCSGMIFGNSNVSKIVATYILQRKNADGTFTTVKAWSSLNTTGTYHAFDELFSVTKGNTYRLKVSATVTSSSGISEFVSTYVDKVY